MTKKDYILNLLTKLDGTREMAGPLQALIEHTDVDAAFIDGLSALLMQAVHEVSDEIEKNRLLASQDFLKTLQEKEVLDTDDGLELDALLQTI